MKVRLVRKVRKQAIIFGTDEHRNAAFRLGDFPHQLTDFLKINIFGDSTHNFLVLVPQRVRISQDTFLRFFVDGGARNGKPLMPRSFKIPSLCPKFLFLLVEFEITTRNELAVHVAVIGIDNVRPGQQLFFQNFFDICFL